MFKIAHLEKFVNDNPELFPKESAERVVAVIRFFPPSSAALTPGGSFLHVTHKNDATMCDTLDSRRRGNDRKG